MRAVRIVVEPFSFISYLEVACVKEINAHGSIKITGIINQDNEKEYIKLAEKELWVSVKGIAEDGEKLSIFEGILTGMHMKKENGVSVFKVEVKTGSILLDMEPHIRSFQNRGCRYTDIIGTCMDVAQGSFVVLQEKEQVRDGFLLQYQETDWEFLKRLASYMGVPVIAEDAVPGKKIYFGYRSKLVKDEICPESYSLEQDYEGHRRKAAFGADAFTQTDAVSYTFESREIYGLGETVRFEGKEFVIGRIRSRLVGQEVCHEYRLITKKGGLLPAIYNLKNPGISLKAEVTAVDNTLVQVRIQDDENKAGSGFRWFDYATVYSTPDGSGWYCMPEVGDIVRLVIPDKDEEHAYTAGSVHLGAAGGRTKPEEKSWKNKQDKEILLTPDSILLRNNKGIEIELSDQNGIIMKSDKDIVVQSDGDIQIKSSGAGVTLSAGNKLLMRQGAARVEMDDQIYIGGGKIYMN